MDAGRALLPGARARAPRRTTTRPSTATFDGPLAAELRARDPGHTGNDAWVDYNEPFYERRVAVPLAACRDLPGRRGALAALPLARRLRRGGARALRAAAPPLPARGRGRRWHGAAALLPPLTTTRRSRSPTAGVWRSRSSPSARRSSRSTAAPLAAALDRRDRAARVHARQHVDPDPRGRLRARCATARACPRRCSRPASRRAAGAPALHRAGARPARAARQRLRAFDATRRGASSRATTRALSSSWSARTSASCATASGTRPSTSSAASSRSCFSSGAGARRGASRRR